MVRSQRWWRTPRKLHLPTRQTGTHRNHGRMHMTHTGSNWTEVPVLIKERRQEVPPLAKTLVAIDVCWERENQFPLIKWYMVNQPHSRAGPVSRSRWTTQSRLYIVSFSLFFLERETWPWVGRELERRKRGELGMEKNNQNVWEKKGNKNFKMAFKCW